ncbi:DUF3431 domain-containing protein [Aspergillus chevalieri]|uniref:Uncharacterized protein n=1 Tax=Aspergillus chevalieri TaxID=182096 RepID=A0A7R7VTN9_ASPCH|nr:uncharacterized protein ACHE_60486S [Aspergillus chevalieri]BCR90600.1 hypothetical protein ACHE_60486S [Aspergillus chevalieri]
MTLTYRVASAALLILAIILIKRHLDHVQDDSRVQPFWQISSPAPASADSLANEFVPETPVIPDNNPAKEDAPAAPESYHDRARPGVGGLRTKPGDRKVLSKKPEYETTPIIVPNDRTIVMAKMSWEDTSWVSNDLNEWRNVIYTVDDPFASRHTPINKGRESLAYLQYIVEHYHDLPATIIFLHSHKDGWPQAWHTDTLSYSNVESVRSLQIDFIQKNGFANLRCQESPGCPDEIQPFRNPPRPGKTAEKFYAQAWKELHNNTDVPEVVAAPCCSQFAVSRDQVLQRPKSDYERYYNWVLTTDLPDDLSARVMEYSWHIIFGQKAVYCPDTFQCYQDVYGSAYFW